MEHENLECAARSEPCDKIEPDVARRQVPVEPYVSDKLKACIPMAGLVLIAGGIGSGKSCLGYAVLESLHDEYPDRPAYAFNFPEEKRVFLPAWMDLTTSEEFPEGSMIIADEAYLTFYAKNHQSDANKFMDMFSGLARQKGILTLFITQTTRKLTLSTVSGVQTFLLKCPDIMMTKLDRAELRPILKDALAAFRAVPAASRQKAVYAISMEHEGIIPEANIQPSFWTEELSKAWQGVELSSQGGGDTSGKWGKYSGEISCVVCLVDDGKIHNKNVAVCSCCETSYCADHRPEHDARRVMDILEG